MKLFLSIATLLLVVLVEVSVAYHWPLESSLFVLAAIAILSVCIANSPLEA